MNLLILWRKWFCKLREENMNLNCETGNWNSHCHRRKEPFAFIVEKYDFDNLKIAEIHNILKHVFKDCRKNFCSHSSLLVNMIGNFYIRQLVKYFNLQNLTILSKSLPDLKNCLKTRWIWKRWIQIQWNSEKIVEK